MSDAKTPHCDNPNVYEIHELEQRGVVRNEVTE